ncbi:MAG: nucleotide exchange factor GrpE [Fusobacteriaceae bacterium]
MTEKEKDAQVEENFDDVIQEESKNNDTSKDEQNNYEQKEVSELEKLTIENEKLKAQVINLEGDYLRKNAEFQNFKKRLDNEMTELRKYAAEKVIIKLLDNVDNLERAIAASSETKDFESLIKGVEMTLGQMKGIMESEGVEAIESEGAEYNPEVHHAVAVEDSPEHDNDKVIQVFSKAYKMKEKIIRPAMVKVCKKC